METMVETRLGATIDTVVFQSGAMIAVSVVLCCAGLLHCKLTV